MVFDIIWLRIRMSGGPDRQLWASLAIGQTMVAETPFSAGSSTRWTLWMSIIMHLDTSYPTVIHFNYADHPYHIHYHTANEGSRKRDWQYLDTSNMDPGEPPHLVTNLGTEMTPFPLPNRTWIGNYQSLALLPMVLLPFDLPWSLVAWSLHLHFEGEIDE